MNTSRLARTEQLAKASHLPLIGTTAYLLGTFLLFLVVGQIGLVKDMIGLSTFVLACIAAFAFGYHVKMRSYPKVGIELAPLRTPTGWIRASSGYYAIYGIALLVAYGASGPLSVVDAILHPGAAYLAKFDVYELQNATGESNSVIQLMTLLAVLYTPLIPFLTLYWSQLSRRLRIVSLASMAIYASFFLYIGTLKGLGDLLVFFVGSYLIRSTWADRSATSHSRRRLVVVSLAALAVLVTYMAFNQAQRLQETGTQDRFPPNPVIASVTGEDFARGMAVVAFYPTHGYVGLAYNLETSFEWSGGLGSSRALNSYWMQYVGGKGASESVYPVRTEARTGWPAYSYWSTIYPWLASDLTFPGTVFVMGIVGWFLARFWYEAIHERSLLAVLLFCQLILLIAFVPANNQIGTSRTSLIAFACLCGAYILKLLSKRKNHP